MDNLITIKENIFILMYKNGKIKQVGGVQPFKEMLKSIHKKSILNHQSYQIWMDKPDLLYKR